MLVMLVMLVVVVIAMTPPQGASHLHKRVIEVPASAASPTVAWLSVAGKVRVSVHRIVGSHSTMEQRVKPVKVAEPGRGAAEEVKLQVLFRLPTFFVLVLVLFFVVTGVLLSFNELTVIVPINVVFFIFILILAVHIIVLILMDMMMMVVVMVVVVMGGFFVIRIVVAVTAAAGLAVAVVQRGIIRNLATVSGSGRFAGSGLTHCPASSRRENLFHILEDWGSAG